jgi:hypothetical protein
MQYDTYVVEGFGDGRVPIPMHLPAQSERIPVELFGFGISA